MTNRTGVLIRKIQALFAFNSCPLMGGEKYGRNYFYGQDSRF